MHDYLLPRKDVLIFSAIDIIDQLGIQGLTIKEIAKRAGISEGAIFKHYKSKNDLILAVLDHFSLYDDEIKQTIRMKEMNAKDAITFFMDAYIIYYESYPAITALTETYHEFSKDPQLAEKTMEIFLSRARFIKLLVEEGQKTGEINSEIDSENLADAILGVFRSICLKWRFTGRNFSFKDRSISAVNMILDAFII